MLEGGIGVALNNCRSFSYSDRFQQRYSCVNMIFVAKQLVEKVREHKVV